MSVLQELFYGNIIPNAGGFDKNSEYGKAMKQIEENEEKLLALLKDTEKRLFIEFANAQSRLNGITAEEKFIEGFKLGMLMMAEVAGSFQEAVVDS